MAEASAPGTNVSAPCDLAQLTTPTYARGRLAKLRRDAGGKGSGRCEMARVYSKIILIPSRRIERYGLEVRKKRLWPPLYTERA